MGTNSNIVLCFNIAIYSFLLSKNLHCIYKRYLVFGWLAQLVEHLVYTEGVKGSSPLLPTKKGKVGV